MEWMIEGLNGFLQPVLTPSVLGDGPIWPCIRPVLWHVLPCFLKPYTTGKAIMLAHAGMFLEEGVAHWEAVNRVNYLGVVYTLKAVVPGMVQRNSGRIIVTNSSGSFMGRKPLNVWPAFTLCISPSVRQLAVISDTQ